MNNYTFSGCSAPEALSQFDATSAQRKHQWRKERLASTGLAQLSQLPLVLCLTQQVLTMGLSESLAVIMIEHHGYSPSGTPLTGVPASILVIFVSFSLSS